MFEINVNPQLAYLLEHHGVTVDDRGEYIQTDLPLGVIFQSRVVYEEINGSISSRLDVVAATNKGEQIIECCGDIGANLDEAISYNFQNFSMSTLHPLLAALGCWDATTYKQITIEDWEINGRIWKAHIGNLVPKHTVVEQGVIFPPTQFFESIEKGITTQKLENRLHWFRGYYCQSGNEIVEREFLMDNELLPDTNELFASIPLMPDIKFYSCRIFIVLRDMDAK